MAGDAAPKSYVSYADYVALERESTTKHEWLDGVIYDMSGGTIEHSGLKAAVVTALSLELRGKRCRVFDSDLKIKVLATGLATYPDASVVCGSAELDPENDHAITNPKVIVEVLSDSSEAYDRGQKFAHYRRIPSLMEYVLVSQAERRIEVFRRNAAGKWELAEEALAGQTAQLTSIECALSVDEVYADPLSAA
ncbi:MAG: Uma2 family endonuclease [Polyangiaceae bacterium]|nr:Uma2 family endonuclease [Polyangiaceae bacterium]